MLTAASNQKWEGKWTATALAVVLCTGISVSNAIELLFLIMVTFSKRKGLYFWSLLLTSFSILPYSIGFLVEYLAVRPHLLGDIMNNLGWAVMITGQSVVLYSRLGVILQKPRVLRFVLFMIIVDGTLFYVTTTIVHYGTYTNMSTFKRAAAIVEKIQMTGFCIQEFIISGLYVQEIWRLSTVLTQRSARRTMWELLIINLAIIFLDIGLLTLEYLSLSILEQTFKGIAYSYKLKMEFAILGKLVSMAQAPSNGEVFFESRKSIVQEEHVTVHSKSVDRHDSFP